MIILPHSGGKVGGGGGGSKIRVHGVRQMRWDRGDWVIMKGQAPGDEGRRDLGHQQTQ